MTAQKETKKMYKIDLMQSLAAKLAALPPLAPTEVNMKEFITGMKIPLVEAVKSGYSFERLSEMLKGDGVDIAPATLKTYLMSKPRSLVRPKKVKIATPAAAS